MRIVAKSEIYFNFIKHQKGAVLDMPDHQAEGLIDAGCAMTEETFLAESNKAKGATAESTALDASPADTAVEAPKGKKPGFKKK